MVKKFLRSETVRLLRLGKKRKKLQKWRKPRGRHNKMRKKRVGYPSTPSIGYGTPIKLRGIINGKRPILVSEMRDLEKITAGHVAVLSRRLGAKKKIEIIRSANERKIHLLNVSGGKS
jgi:large subunit ribosomal protein L32e